MTRPRYPEHDRRRPLPDVVYVCTRCQRGLLTFLGPGDGSVYQPSPERSTPYCYTCNNDELGAPYARVEVP